MNSNCNSNCNDGQQHFSLNTATSKVSGVCGVAPRRCGTQISVTTTEMHSICTVHEKHNFALHLFSLFDNLAITTTELNLVRTVHEPEFCFPLFFAIKASGLVLVRSP